MDTRTEFDGTLLSVCEYLEIADVFNDKVRSFFSRIRVGGIESDSRNLKEGDIFVARRGRHFNPFEHLREIKSKKVAAVLIEAESELKGDDGESGAGSSRAGKAALQLMGSVTGGIACDADEDFSQRLRSGALASQSDYNDPEGAQSDYHAVANRADAAAVTDENMILLVLPRNRSLSALAGFIYKEPSRRLRLIGVTGTNGKSTVTHMIAQMLNMTGHRCAVFGTTGYGFLGDLKKAANTTPDPVTLQKELARYADLGADYAVLEVSSIGFCEKRVAGLHFYAGGFTNLSRDHLDYHKTMDDYRLSKLAFLKSLPASRRVINVTRESGRRMLEDLQGKGVSVGVECAALDSLKQDVLNAQRVNFRPDGSEIFLAGANGRYLSRAVLHLLGRFNVENFTLALGIMMAMGFSPKTLCALSHRLRPVTGRMERFSVEGAPALIVDYAHTPDGLEQALKAVAAHASASGGRIFVVIGCGGDRDRTKRPVMAMKASIFADYAIFTSDNPRGEDPLRILEDMALAVYRPCGGREEPFAVSRFEKSDDEILEEPLPTQDGALRNVVIIPDRELAVRYAFRHAKSGDCVLVAGKGHEEYQIFSDRTIRFSDRELCCGLLGISLEDHDRLEE